MIPQSLLDQLHYVKVEDPAIDLHYFPNYLIVGPQRTGTTWLSYNLRFHPQIMVTVPKEIFFFNRLNEPDHPYFQSDKLDWYLNFFQESPTSEAWNRKRLYSLMHFDEPYSPIMRGEATASYATLDERVVREIALLNPQVRIVFIIRNPIDRAWSHAKMDFTQNRGRRIEDITKKEFEKFFNRPHQRKCAQYTQNIDRWLSCIGKSSVFIGCFDDLQNRPVRFLLDVMTFLGVRSDKRYIHPGVNKVLNATSPIQIPPDYREMLKSLLREDMRNLEERFGVRWP